MFIDHVHSAPDSMSSVAWMVIMGDGLHNFTDGMAIGAAFSASIAGGFSTTIAVFCHELPHELGKSIFFFILSIFNIFVIYVIRRLCSWMFAAAAGMFIYIALVDMVNIN